MDDLVQPALAFIAAHANWAAAIVFVTAFIESFAFLSLLFPGTTLLIAAGTLLPSGTLPYAPVLTGAVLGATLGDTASYWIGRRFGGGIARTWPFSRHPELLPNGIDFFARHGGRAFSSARFFGPLRAVIPLAAGLLGMPRGWFWFANIASALVWAPMLLLAGDLIGGLGDRLIGAANTFLLVFGGLTISAIVALAWLALRGGKR